MIIYDIYKVLDKRQIKPNIKIRKNAKYKKGNEQSLAWRNKSIKSSKQKMGQGPLSSILRKQ